MIELVKIKKANSMKIRAVAIPLISFLLGGSLVAGLLLERVIPNLNSSLSPDVAFIDLGESQGNYKYAVELGDNQKRYNYADILGDYQLAKTYLWNPLYFYKKVEGLEMLKKLAEQNYTQAAVSLGLYHKDRVSHYTHKQNPEKIKEHSDKFYDWAKLAAEQGDESLLLMYVKNNPANLAQKELAEDLKILERWAEESSWPTPAWEMSDYYEGQGNQEKAAKFDVLFTERLESPGEEPACTTITPWRGL